MSSSSILNIILNNTTNETIRGYKQVGSKIRMTESPHLVNDPHKNILLYFYGELYNYNDLYEMMGISPQTKHPEHEIIIHLYKQYGMEYTLMLLNGRFSLVLLDNNIYHDSNLLYCCVDILGLIPIRISTDGDIHHIQTGSHGDFEMEHKKECKTHNELTYTHFVAGSYCSFRLSSNVLSSWRKEHEYLNGGDKKHTGRFPVKISPPLPTHLTDENKKYFHFCMFSQNPMLEIQTRKERFNKILFDIKEQLNQSIEQIYFYYLEKITPNDSVVLQESPVYRLPLSCNSFILRYVNDHLKHLVGENPFEPTCKLEDIEDDVKYAEGEDFKKNILHFNMDGFEELAGSHVSTRLNCVDYDFQVRQNLFHINISSTGNENVCSPFLNKNFILFYLSIHPYIRCKYREKLLFYSLQKSIYS